jgi:hypothetical protein
VLYNMEEVGIRVCRMTVFSYNNSYQESLKMVLFEMLYGRRCRTPLFYNETGERKIFGPDVQQEVEKKSVWLGRTYELRNQGRRATLINEEES